MWLNIHQKLVAFFSDSMPFSSGVAEMQSMNGETIIDVNTYSMIYLDRDALDSQVVLVIFLDKSSKQ